MAKLSVEYTPLKDPLKARDFFEEAIKGGEDRLIPDFAKRLVSGDGVEQDVSAGVSWFEKGLERNLDAARFEYAKLLLDGQGITADPMRGEQLLRELIARESPRSSHVIELCTRLAYGDSVERNAKEAANILSKQADRGNLETMISFAQLSMDESLNDFSLGKGMKYLGKGMTEKGVNRILSFLDWHDHALTGLVDDEFWHKAFAKLEVLRSNGFLYEIATSSKDLQVNLSIGILVRSGISKDPENLTLQERLRPVRESNWYVPDWMDEEESSSG